MKKLALAAGALCVLSSVSARAADLDYDRGPSDRRAYVYEDPRYADIYTEPRRAPAPHYDYRHDYRPAPPPATYHDPRHSGRAEHCVAKDEIRHRLTQEGWRDFHSPEVHGPFASLRARRVNGDLYQLKVDRCSGDVVSAQIVERARTYGHAPGGHAPGYGYAPAPGAYAPGPGYGPYAYDEPRRWPRAY